MRTNRSFRNLQVRIGALSIRYQQAEARLASLVARTILSGGLGTPKVQRLVKRQVRVMLEELDAAGVKDGGLLIDLAYDMGRRIAGTDALQGRIDDTALNLLKDSLEGRLTGATDTVGRRVDDVFRKEGLRAAAAALGGSDTEASVSLQRSLTRYGVSGFTDSTGRMWSLESYATMAIKTTTAEAIFQGTMTTMLRDGLDLVDVNKVTTPCDACKEYDGKTFSLTGATPGYPVLDITFPIHPHCFHYIKPSVARSVAA